MVLDLLAWRLETSTNLTFFFLPLKLLILQLCTKAHEINLSSHPERKQNSRFPTYVTEKNQLYNTTVVKCRQLTNFCTTSLINDSYYSTVVHFTMMYYWLKMTLMSHMALHGSSATWFFSLHLYFSVLHQQAMDERNEWSKSSQCVKHIQFHPVHTKHIWQRAKSLKSCSSSESVSSVNRLY